MWTEKGAYVAADAQVFDLESAAVGDTLEITVATPLLYDAVQGLLPTLYVLDGALCRPIVSGIAGTLGALGVGSFPQLIVVGISYPTSDFMEHLSLRSRDLTPTAAALPPSPIPMDKHGTGGGPQLLESLFSEVFPFVEERVRSDPSDRCIVGWSLGGLFGASALLSRPDAFRRYLLVSPSLWWDDEVTLRRESELTNALTGDVFIGVGDLEQTAPARMWPPVPEESAAFANSAAMVSNARAFARRLRSRGLNVNDVVFPDEHHTTVFPAALTRGLMTLYSS